VTDSSRVGYTTAMFVTMNLRVWKKLPADLQKVFTDVSKEWVDKHGAAWDEADAEGKAFIENLGKPIHPLSAEESARWVEAVKPVLDDYVAAARKKGLPGYTFVKDIRSALAEEAKRPK